MSSTNRAAAVLEKAPPDAGFPVPELKALVGQTVTIAAVEISSEHTHKLTAFAKLVDSTGKEHTVELGDVMEIRDEGVCGYALEDHFDDDVIRKMLEEAIADETNGLDSDDRDSLREDLTDLFGDDECDECGTTLKTYMKDDGTNLTEVFGCPKCETVSD